MEVCTEILRKRSSTAPGQASGERLGALRFGAIGHSSSADESPNPEVIRLDYAFSIPGAKSPRKIRMTPPYNFDLVHTSDPR
jgi:hypothetical protein